MNPMLQQFTAVALPIMFTFLIAVWVNNKAFDGVHRSLDDIVQRLDRIEKKLDDHETRISRLEGQASPITRGR
jgi:hypothetical protein